MTLNGVMAVTLRYFTEFGKPALQKTICGGIYARAYCIFSACTTSSQRNFTFAISSPDEFLVFRENSRSSSLYVVVRPSVCLSSVTLVHPNQAIEIFGNVSTPCGTLAIRDLCVKILRRSSQGNPSVGGVKHKSGSRI